MKNQTKRIFFCIAIAGAFSCAPFTSSNAQTLKSNEEVSQTALSPFQKNQKLIKEFSGTHDLQKATVILSQIQNNLQEEIAYNKRQISIAKESGDEAKANESLKKTENLGKIYNRIILASRSSDKLNQSAVAAVLADYQKLH